MAKILRAVTRCQYFDDSTKSKADYILDAFAQRFLGSSLFEWNGTTILRRKPRTDVSRDI